MRSLKQAVREADTLEGLSTRHAEISAELGGAVQTIRFLIAHCRRMERMLASRGIPIPDLDTEVTTEDLPNPGSQDV
jgi:hypothetical protein